jgi:flavodoxin
MEDKSDKPPVKSLIILFSYHHKNTEKLAKVFANVLGADIRLPPQVKAEELKEYDFIGFGSGIYDGKHHKSLLDFADSLPESVNGKAFLFSTTGVPIALFGKKFVDSYRKKSHSALREKLQAKGISIVGEFNCAGFNTNSFLIRFGGINKGRPNAEDLKHAEEFARNLLQKL